MENLSLKNKIYLCEEPADYHSENGFRLIIAKDIKRANYIGYDNCADPNWFTEIGETDLEEQVILEGCQRAAEYWDVDFWCGIEKWKKLK